MAHEIDTSGRPTKTDMRRLRAEARSNDRLLAAVYEDGRREGRREARSSRARSSSKGASAVRRQVRRARPGARQLTNPRSAEVSSGIQLVGLTLAVVALYLVLTNASHVSGVVGGIGRALEWLASPTASIPYSRPSSSPPPASPSPVHTV